tara:strand:- start:663 stop:1046 length:384 start_codon:yes stop_codon:yes gene_type:complete
MANHKGSEGVVKVSSATVAEIRDWSLSETAETIDDTTMGAAARTKKSSLTSASGSLTAFWDETDTAGQGAMTIGALVSLILYPEGAAGTTATISAIITEKGVSATLDGMVETSISFEAAAAVVWANP